MSACIRRPPVRSISIRDRCSPIVIADEVNRANTKAQSAMLEAMGEGQISVDGHTHRLRQIRSIERVRDIRAACRRVTLAPEMASYIVALSATTRDAQGVRFGVSPRGSLNVAAMTRARALMQGRDFVMADDVRSVVVPVLAHRVCAGVDAGCGSA
ncbi:MoxR-like ATPase [Bifidobacterium bifidum]|uniref:AAA family ATPase n=1 Tax=Bifidobacterium bifidum TaxID=1681 RepID=UPI0008E8C694|nr:MoxR family ATPase [Bifidobacterium bifidum]SFB93184.1 MoxR-like ATPase [Bifidobacterium bifidum]